MLVAFISIISSTNESLILSSLYKLGEVLLQAIDII